MAYPRQVRERSAEPVLLLWASQHIQTGGRALRKTSSRTVRLSLVLSRDRISPAGSGAATLTMRPRTWASRCCVWLPRPQRFCSELQKLNQLKHAKTGSCLCVFHVLSCGTGAKYSRTQDCADDVAPSMYDIRAAFQRGKKPAQPSG